MRRRPLLCLCGHVTVSGTEEAMLETNDMRMLRWMCGGTKKDKTRNEYVRGTTRETQISKKITDKRLKWFRRVMRMDEEHIVKTTLMPDIAEEGRKNRPG